MAESETDASPASEGEANPAESSTKGTHPVLGCLAVLAFLGLCGLIAWFCWTFFFHPLIAPYWPVRPPDFTGLTAEDAQWTDARYLAADPERYKDRHVYLRGESMTVRQQGDYTWMSFKADPYQFVVVRVFPKNPELLANEPYCVYGLAGGLNQMTSGLTGASSEYPLVDAYEVIPMRGNCPGKT